MLRQQGVDLKIAQELLRHANPRITLELYQQAVGEERRVAQDLAFRGLLEGNSSFNATKPFATLEGHLRANVTAINH